MANKNEATFKANINIDKDMWERFKRVAKHNDSTASQLVRLFVKDYMSKNSRLELK